MPRSSEQVAALAGALAKAQSELTNPEKSLIATLPAEHGQRERTFRYAPLSAGLDIVRQTLGRHEIAIIQSTGYDPESGLIKLTTTLAHASGEWIASDWPVCALADLATPQRMGAALTYARRYGLFTLVGIAGDDDLDAPDAPDVRLQQPEGAPARVPVVSSPSLSPASGQTSRKSSTARVTVTLDAEASLQQRDGLLTEIAKIASFDEAAAWAKRIIPTKNTLTKNHADEVEAALRDRLAGLDGPVEQELEQSAEAAPLSQTEPLVGNDRAASTTFATPDRSSLRFGHSPLRRNKAHLKFVASQPCLLCGRHPSDPHHLRFAQTRAFGRKVSDEFTVPLCRTHHRQLHRSGNELEWWKAVAPGVDPLHNAKTLWGLSHPTT